MVSGSSPATARSSVDFPQPDGPTTLTSSPSATSRLKPSSASVEPLTTGAIAYDGADLAGVPTHKRGFALMFQDGQLFEHQTVGGNVGYPLRLRHRRRGEVDARVGELLELGGLSGYAGRQPSTLSGGERQRVALARALAVEPRLLLLDEPLSALDKTLRERLAGDLRSILTKAGTTALLVTHDHEEAFAVADRMAVMRAGRLVQAGRLSDVWQHPADADTARFLGYASVLSGEAAQALITAARLPPGDVVALRRSALTVAGTGQLAGTVLGAALSPEMVRLTIDVDNIGVLDAVSRTDVPTPVPGQRVSLEVDVTRLALVGIERNPVDRR